MSQLNGLCIATFCVLNAYSGECGKNQYVCRAPGEPHTCARRRSVLWTSAGRGNHRINRSDSCKKYFLTCPIAASRRVLEMLREQGRLTMPKNFLGALFQYMSTLDLPGYPRSENAIGVFAARPGDSIMAHLVGLPKSLDSNILKMLKYRKNGKTARVACCWAREKHC